MEKETGCPYPKTPPTAIGPSGPASSVPHSKISSDTAVINIDSIDMIVAVVAAMRQEVELNRQNSSPSDCLSNGACCREQLLLGNARSISHHQTLLTHSLTH